MLHETFDIDELWPVFAAGSCFPTRTKPNNFQALRHLIGSGIAAVILSVVSVVMLVTSKARPHHEKTVAPFYECINKESSQSHASCVVSNHCSHRERKSSLDAVGWRRPQRSATRASGSLSAIINRKTLLL